VRPLRLPGGIGTNRPSSEDRSSTLARRPGLSSGWRHHRCGTAPDSHRLRCAQHHPGANPGTGTAYCTSGRPYRRSATTLRAGAATRGPGGPRSLGSWSSRPWSCLWPAARAAQADTPRREARPPGRAARPPAQLPQASARGRRSGRPSAISSEPGTTATRRPWADCSVPTASSTWPPSTRTPWAALRTPGPVSAADPGLAATSLPSPNASGDSARSCPITASRSSSAGSVTPAEVTPSSSPDSPTARRSRWRKPNSATTPVRPSLSRCHLLGQGGGARLAPDTSHTSDAQSWILRPRL
jgi:hypothetical protein